MKAEISEDGEIIIKPQHGTEVFALKIITSNENWRDKVIIKYD